MARPLRYSRLHRDAERLGRVTRLYIRPRAARPTPDYSHNRPTTLTAIYHLGRYFVANGFARQPATTHMFVGLPCLADLRNVLLG